MDKSILNIGNSMGAVSKRAQKKYFGRMEGTEENKLAGKNIIHGICLPK